jgi:hypothetical protein
MVGPETRDELRDPHFPTGLNSGTPSTGADGARPDTVGFTLQGIESLKELIADQKR